MTRTNRRRARGTTGMESLERRRLLAFDLLSDVTGLSATPSITVDGVAYFFADDGVAGRELWRSDGTAAGTRMVKDLTPGPASTHLDSFFEANGRAVVVTAEHASIALDGVYTLWSTDGTADGTVELASFQTAGSPLSKQVGEQVALLFYREHKIADETLHDALLYFTDGTVGGTRLVKEFIANPNDNEIGSPLNWIFGTDDRVVFYLNSYELWSSDGTPQGTINLTPKIHPPEVDPDREEPSDDGPFDVHFDSHFTADVGGKVVISAIDLYRKLWVTDGTLEGTVARVTEADGGIQNAKVAGDTYYFYVDNYKHAVRNQTLYAFDVGRGTIQAIYSPRSRGPEDQNRLSFLRAGERLLFTDMEMGSGAPGETPTYDTTLWSTDGTPGGAVKLADLSPMSTARLEASLGATAYFVVVTPGRPGGNETMTGARGFIDGITVDASAARAELWRSDGTPAGTGVVRTLLQGEDQIANRHVDYTLTSATGKLVLRTVVKERLTAGGWPGFIESLPTLLDDTAVYDPRELTVGRQGATARLVNGVLHLRGSIGDDTFRLFRRASDPDEIVVEYNGNVRGFAFSSIRRIVADLQSGNDAFDIVETGGEAGAIRIRTSILGGDGADTINTGRGRDTILGGSGADVIRARGNGDVIQGGGGRDRLSAGAGDDQISGGGSYDRVTAGPGADVLFGQSVIELAFGRDLEGEDLDEDVLLG